MTYLGLRGGGYYYNNLCILRKKLGSKLKRLHCNFNNKDISCGSISFAYGADLGETCETYFYRDYITYESKRSGVGSITQDDLNGEHPYHQNPDNQRVSSIFKNSTYLQCLF